MLGLRRFQNFSEEALSSRKAELMTLLENEMDWDSLEEFGELEEEELYRKVRIEEKDFVWD